MSNAKVNSSRPWPEELRIIAGAGVGAAVAKSWGGVLAADTGIKLRIAVEDSVVDRFRWVADGRFHLTAGGTNKTRQMLEVEPKFVRRDGGPFPVRIAWSQSHDNAGFFVRADSKIKSVYDIKPGTRISGMTQAGTSPILDGLLAWAKVAKEDIAWIPIKDIPDKTWAVMEGRADVSFGIPSSQPVSEAEKTAPGIRWLPLDASADPEAARRFNAVDPVMNFAPILNGVPSSLGVWGTCGTSLYTTSADVAPGFISQLARWLDENWAKYKDLHSWNKFMNRELLVRELNRTFIPCHEGLVDYLREAGLWSEAHQRRQDANVALVDRYCEAYPEALALADEKLIQVRPECEDWLRLWEDYKKARGLPGFRVFFKLDE
jgi:uncharacterized protein